MVPEVNKRVVQKANKSVKSKDHIKKMPFTWLGGVQVVLADDPQPQNFVSALYPLLAKSSTLF